jgi:arylsulfatase A-like enzyme
LYVSYKENFEGEPTGRDNPEMLKMHPSHGHDQSIQNGISRIGYQKGGKSAMWVDEDLADDFTEDAVKWLKEHKDQPFFLYFALHQPHVPRTPNERFVGASGLGPRGDVIKEADWSVGEIIKTLDDLGLRDKTLVIFSSDNGPVVDDGYMDDAVELLGDHDVNGPLRGGKYSLFDAGTRVPFIVNWPEHIDPGVSAALISQVDMIATIADLLKINIESGAEDSQVLTDALLGKSPEGRSLLFMEAGGKVAMQKDGWYLIPPYKGPAVYRYVNIESGCSPEYQLYSKGDTGQLNNMALAKPELLKELRIFFNQKMGITEEAEEQEFK